MNRSNFAAELCQYRNNTDLLAGFSCPNPIPRTFDTETDSDPDPDLASPWTFSDALQLEAVRKGLRIRMGRYPAEIAEGGGVLGGGKRDLHRSRSQQLSWSTESVSLKITSKR
ncbi:MAG: hypothetical protein ACOX52_18705 [Verrucomicrobiota bacterium]